MYIIFALVNGHVYDYDVPAFSALQALGKFAQIYYGIPVLDIRKHTSDHVKREQICKRLEESAKEFFLRKGLYKEQFCNQ